MGGSEDQNDILLHTTFDNFIDNLSDYAIITVDLLFCFLLVPILEY